MNLHELKRLAEAADRGEWECDENSLDQRFDIWSGGGYLIGAASNYNGKPVNRANGLYIAALNPATALKLLAVVEAAEQGLRALQASMARMDKHHYEDALRGRLENNPVDAIHALRAALEELK